MPNPTRIVITGGGFAGIYAALRLEKTLARDRDVEVTLVNRDNFILFTPMLHEVAAGDLDAAHVVNPVRALLKRARFFCGTVEAIDLPARRVTVAHGNEHHRHELTYDHLVLALGSTTNYFGIPGLRRHAFTMKTLGDAIALRNHVIRNLEEADFECCAHLRDKLLTFVVAGGGFAGVETIGALNDFVREALHAYPNLSPGMLRVVLVHSGERLLPELGEQLGAYARRRLVRRGVEVCTDTRVKEVSDEGVQLSDSTSLPAHTLVWTAGTSPNPILESLPCAKDRGRVRVDEFMECPEWPGVWAVGDCASIHDPRTGQPFPPTAQHAVRQGRRLADNLRAAVRGGKKKAFSFRTLGQLATIGHRAGVAQVFGLRFSGILAWWLWRTIYLTKLPRFPKKVRVALDWTLDLIFRKDLTQLVTLRSSGERQRPENATRSEALLTEARP